MESLEDRKSLRPLSPSDHRAYQIFAVGEPCKPNAEHVEINEGKREVRNGFVNLLHHKWWAPLAGTRGGRSTFAMKPANGPVSSYAARFAIPVIAFPPINDQEHNDPADRVRGSTSTRTGSAR